MSNHPVHHHGLALDHAYREARSGRCQVERQAFLTTDGLGAHDPELLLLGVVLFDDDVARDPEHPLPGSRYKKSRVAARSSHKD